MVFETSYIFTIFASNSFKQLNKILQQLESWSPSSKMSPATVLQPPELKVITKISFFELLKKINNTHFITYYIKTYSLSTYEMTNQDNY